MLALTGDAEGFATACEKLRGRGLLNVAFQRIEAYKEHIPLQNMQALTQALCDVGDRFPVGPPGGFFEADMETHAVRLVYFGLKREPDEKTRYQVLRDALTHSKGLALPVELVSLEERIPERNERAHDFLVEEVALPELKAICVEKLRAAAQKEEFRRDARLGTLLWRWSEWSSKEEVRAWVSKYASTPEGAVWLLVVLLGETHSWGHEHRVRYYIHLPTVERFADVSALAQLVEEVDAAKLTKKQGRAVQEFKNALKRRADGRPDDAWRSEREGYGDEIGDG